MKLARSTARKSTAGISWWVPNRNSFKRAPGKSGVEDSEPTPGPSKKSKTMKRKADTGDKPRLMYESMYEKLDLKLKQLPANVVKDLNKQFVKTVNAALKKQKLGQQQQ